MNNKTVNQFPKTSVEKENYAVILAGGDGSRLKSLTRMIVGDERPKQFCPILDNETLLDVTRRRVALKIPAENTFFSLTAKHERFYREILAGVSDEKLIVQPENKGTAPAILYSLLYLEKLSPEATVAFFPSDHYVSDDEVFMENVGRAFRAVETMPSSVVLLGIEPDSAETSYGWIEPVESLFDTAAGAVSQVQRFWEKPSFESANYLLKKGCLWNSFVMVGKAKTFLELIRKHTPDLFKLFTASTDSFWTKREKSVVRSLYSLIYEVNFSSDVLEKSADELYVLRVADVKWSDWGEPQRVIGTLENLGVPTKWMQLVAA